MRILTYTLVLVILTSVFCFAEVDQITAKSVTIEPEIELPIIKIHLPQKNTVKPVVQKIETAEHIPRENQIAKPISPLNLEPIDQNYPRPLKQ